MGVGEGSCGSPWGYRHRWQFLGAPSTGDTLVLADTLESSLWFISAKTWPHLTACRYKCWDASKQERVNHTGCLKTLRPQLPLAPALPTRGSRTQLRPQSQNPLGPEPTPRETAVASGQAPPTRVICQVQEKHNLQPFEPNQLTVGQTLP